MGLSKLWESKQKIDRLNRRAAAEPPARYEDRYKRLTLHIQNKLYDELQRLRRLGFTQTAVVNAALEEFLEKEMPPSDEATKSK